MEFGVASDDLSLLVAFLDWDSDVLPALADFDVFAVELVALALLKGLSSDSKKRLIEMRPNQ